MSPRRLVAGMAATALLGLAGVAPPTVAQPAPATTGDPSPSADAATSPPPAPGTAAAEVPGHLAAELGAAVARVSELASTGDLGVAVVAPDGTEVWSVEADATLVPASAMKTLTAAAVLDTLGPAGRITTAATGTAPVGPQGVLAGDLVMHGVGDPTLTTDEYRRWVYPARPATDVEELAERIVAAGVRRVTGDLVGDGTSFGVAATAAGWPPRYLADFDAHYLSGLTVDTGRVVEVSDPPGGSPSLSITHAPDPALRTVQVLARELAERGVRIDGQARRTVRPTVAVHPVATVRSPPMDQLLAFMLQRSDNHLADTLVRAAAVRSGGTGTWQAAGTAVRRALDAAGVDTSGLVVSDGSGLSRTNRVSASQLATTDLALYDRYGQAWSRALAVAGEAGTLEGRLLGTSAAGRLSGKTGTLADVRALAGHVVGPGGGHYHFALLANDIEAIRWQASILGDEIALLLTDALDGCRRRRVVEVEVPAESLATDEPGVTPTPEPETRTQRRPVTATPDDPGPFLLDGAWERSCPAG